MVALDHLWEGNHPFCACLIGKDWSQGPTWVQDAKELYLAVHPRTGDKSVATPVAI